MPPLFFAYDIFAVIRLSFFFFLGGVPMWGHCGVQAQAQVIVRFMVPSASRHVYKEILRYSYNMCNLFLISYGFFLV